MRHVCFWLLAVVLTPTVSFGQTSLEALVSRPEAAHHGLERMWFTYVEVGGSSNRVEAVSFEGGTLFVQTTGGLLHAIDGESGRTLWTSQLGSRGGESFPAAADHTYVASITGTTLNLLRREDGVPIWNRKLVGVPQAAAGLTNTLVMVPTAGGIVEHYDLANQQFRPTQFNAQGRDVFAPVTTDKTIYLLTGNGHLHALHADSVEVRFDWVSNDTVYAGPAHGPGNVFIGSGNGFVYAVDDQRGSTRWQFSTGAPVRKSPIVVGDRVYVLAESGTFAISAADGSEIWFVPRAETFIAATATKVYLMDRRSQVYVIDAQTGARLDTFPLDQNVRPFQNSYTDRIYLVTDGGLVQCLREIEQVQPIVHVPAKVKSATAATQEVTPAQPRTAPEPEEVPQDDPEPAADATDADAMPAEEPASEDNPFGGEGAATEENPFGS